MKIRQGFVSNSSSTSFCIVGVDTETVKDIALVLGWTTKEEMYNKQPYTVWSGPGGDCFGYGAWYPRKSLHTSLVMYGNYSPEYIGIDAKELWVDKNLNFEQAKKVVIDEIKRISGVEVKDYEISLIANETGEG